MMFRKEIAVALKSCLTDIQAAGELYFQPAKRGGIYLTVMLHGMDAVHTQTVLCMETEHKTVKFPLPVPCQGLIELCQWSCLPLEEVNQAEFSLYSTTGKKLMSSKA